MKFKSFQTFYFFFCYEIPMHNIFNSSYHHVRLKSTYFTSFILYFLCGTYFFTSIRLFLSTHSCVYVSVSIFLSFTFFTSLRTHVSFTSPISPNISAVFSSDLRHKIWRSLASEHAQVPTLKPSLSTFWLARVHVSASSDATLNVPCVLWMLALLALSTSTPARPYV